MYEARKRRPLRSYRRVREADFFIDGDPDPVDLIFPSPDGFEQERILFDRRNGWNADIVAAAKELITEVSDPSAAVMAAICAAQALEVKVAGPDERTLLYRGGDYLTPAERARIAQ